MRLAASHGITAVIHPGGSMRDADSIKACDELGLAMQLTGRRHFLHLTLVGAAGPLASRH